MFPNFSPCATDARQTLQSLDFSFKGAGQGRNVCIVSDCSDRSIQKLLDGFGEGGWQVTVLDLAIADQPDQSLTKATHVRLAGIYEEKNWYIQVQSLGAYHWLRDKSFDLIIFNDRFSAGFYSFSAKHLGLAFSDTSLVVFADEAHAHNLYCRKQFPSGRHDLEFDYMERQTAAMADGVVFGSTALAQWALEAGWKLPAACGALGDKGGMDCGTWLQSLSKSAKSKISEPVFISVCIATFNQAKFLREALTSLENQTYPNFEVIVMDDGSTSSDVELLKNELQNLFKRRNWRWLRQENTGPAIARNQAANHAVGSYLLFMDDDNIAYPDELERFALAAQRDPEIVACIIGMHPDSQMAFPPTLQLPERQGAGIRPVGWTPLGGDLALSVYINGLGETNSLFRRDVFQKLGGFHCNNRANFEDFDLLIRALIAGFHIDVLPEILMLYRRTCLSRSMDSTMFEGHINSLRAIADLMPPALRPLLLTLRHEWYERHRSRCEGLLEE
ncbi:MAG: glycosyltransferase family A protein [Alphaproteobacteria bacterium]|nr:glycosyltransferase family A protein [Alphaproteobacteria bacterium]